MAETNTCCMISRTSDVIAMKETLGAQQQLLQRLYIELEQEREAAATAVSEALDMILRLQGEKAAVEMEAGHYKRMAEEKIGHGEASLEAFEELLNQKEMEIASLEFQVQAYRHKLMSFGCDLTVSEFKFPDDPMLNIISDKRNGENEGQSSNLRRLHSIPTIQFKKVNPPSIEYDDGTTDSYLNQIKTLNEQVRVIPACTEREKNRNLSGGGGSSYTVFADASTEVTCDLIDELSHCEITHDGEGISDDSPCLLNVHDVFEVPQTSEKHKVSEHVEKRLAKWNYNAESRLTKPDSMSEGMVESRGAEKKKGMLRVHSEIKTPCPKDMMTTLGQRKEGKVVDCNYQAEFQKLNQRIARLERERVCVRQEITCEGNGEELWNLLKDIQSQLNLIQSEMRGWKPIKATPMDDVSLASLQEAMLHFWL